MDNCRLWPRNYRPETVTYSGAAGYYVWKVLADSGTGSYQLQITHP